MADDRGERWALGSVSVFDGRHALPGVHDVVVAGGRIEDVAPAGASARRELRVVPGEGTWVLPGLIDTHVHSTFPAEMTCYVRNGVTAVRYAGNLPADVEALRLAVGAGDAPAPRIFSCGPMIDGSPPSYPEVSEVAETPAEGRRLARRLLAEGSDSLLAVQQVEADVLAAIIEEGHAGGVPVFGQLWRVDAAEAARVGIDQLDNTSRVFASREVPEEEFARPRPVGERIAVWRRGWATVDADATRGLMEAMVDRGVAYCPTFVRSLWAAGAAPGTEEHLLADPDADLFGEEELDAWRRRLGRGRIDPEDVGSWSEVLEALYRWIGEFHAMGGTIVAGTDAQYGGILLHEELSQLREAGLDADAALASATGNAGVAVGRGGELGCVRPGAVADLVQTSADPRAEPGTTRRPLLVVIGGAVVYEGRESERSARGRL
jgi:hypothetical protein